MRQKNRGEDGSRGDRDMSELKYVKPDQPCVGCANDSIVYNIGDLCPKCQRTKVLTEDSLKRINCMKVDCFIPLPGGGRMKANRYGGSK